MTNSELENKGPTPLVVAVGSVAFLQQSNNDRLIAAQEYGGLRESTGEVTISFYGVMAFKITTPKGLEIFIDPWRNPAEKGWGVPYLTHLPTIKCDIGMVTHAHADHDGYECLDAGMILDRMTGVYEFGDVKITGIADKHVCEPQNRKYNSKMLEVMFGKHTRPPNEPMEWCNTMYLLETGGMRILHWGDNRQNPPQEVWDRIEDIDVAILPIDDHILTDEWGEKIAQKLNAKVIIPSHYYIKGIWVPNFAWIEDGLSFTKSHEHTILDTHTISLSPDKIKDYKQHVMYFGENVAFPLMTWQPSDLQAEVLPLPEPARAWERYKPEKGDRY